jgi:16S rRNA processing protein RimM
MKAESWSDVPERFRVGAGFWVMSEPPVRVTLTGVAGALGGTLTLRFEGCASVDVVDGWRGCGLAIEEAERAPLSGDRVYHDELKGMVVATESGVSVGIVREVWSTGPYDLLVLDSGGTERLFPMVRELVVRVDRQRRLVTVRPPNGWLDDAAL